MFHHPGCSVNELKDISTSIFFFFFNKFGPRGKEEEIKTSDFHYMRHGLQPIVLSFRDTFPRGS